ncbi:MAG: hypothetical protein ACOWWO_03440 [Peptococcaceae bacterium]
MKRLAIIWGLIMLIIFVIISYIIFANSEKAGWYINEGGNFIPVVLSEKPHSFSLEFLKPTYWGLLGILALLYLKILWKIISSNWRAANNKEIKRLRGYK